MFLYTVCIFRKQLAVCQLHSHRKSESLPAQCLTANMQPALNTKHLTSLYIALLICVFVHWCVMYVCMCACTFVAALHTCMYILSFIAAYIVASVIVCPYVVQRLVYCTVDAVSDQTGSSVPQLLQLSLALTFEMLTVYCKCIRPQAFIVKGPVLLLGQDGEDYTTATENTSDLVLIGWQMPTNRTHKTHFHLTTSTNAGNHSNNISADW